MKCSNSETIKPMIKICRFDRTLYACFGLWYSEFRSRGPTTSFKGRYELRSRGATNSVVASAQEEWIVQNPKCSWKVFFRIRRKEICELTSNDIGDDDDANFHRENSEFYLEASQTFLLSHLSCVKIEFSFCTFLFHIKINIHILGIKTWILLPDTL